MFDHDVHTVVFADGPTRIPAALARVAAGKRPTTRFDLMKFYADRFGDHAVMLYCFDNVDSHQGLGL